MTVLPLWRMHHTYNRSGGQREGKIWNRPLEFYKGFLILNLTPGNPTSGPPPFYATTMIGSQSSKPFKRIVESALIAPMKLLNLVSFVHLLATLGGMASKPWPEWLPFVGNRDDLRAHIHFVFQFVASNSTEFAVAIMMVAIMIMMQYSISKSTEKIVTSIESMEKKIETMVTSNESMEKKIETMVTSIESMEKKIETMVTSNESMEKKIETMVTSIESMEKKIETMVTSIESMEKKIETMVTSIDRLVTGIETMVTGIALIKGKLQNDELTTSDDDAESGEGQDEKEPGLLDNMGGLVDEVADMAEIALCSDHSAETKTKKVKDRGRGRSGRGGRPSSNS